jgi:hypothetical protein
MVVMGQTCNSDRQTRREYKIFMGKSLIKALLVILRTGWEVDGIGKHWCYLH